MNPFRFRHRFAAALALLALGAGASAQELAPIPQELPTNVPVGEIFEIIGAGLPTDAWSWTLTKDGSFLEASRERVFHLRLLEPGAYTLEAMVINPDRGTQVRRNIVLNAQSLPVPPPSASDMLVVADPAFTQQGIALPAGKQLLKLTPTGNAKGRIRVDLDSLHDSDGDGDPANDDETQGALFATDGTPIYVWFPRITRGQAMILSAETASGSPATAKVPVSGVDVPEEKEGDTLPPLTPDDIHVNVNGNGDVTFAMPVTADRQDVLLYRWDFGDGHESLRDVPTHRYFREGTYTVKAQALDMRTGQVLTSAEREITITASDMLPPSSSSSAEGARSSSRSSVESSSSSSVASTASSSVEPVSSASSVASGGKGFDMTFLWTILKLIGVAILAVAVGLGLSWLLGKGLKALRSAREKKPDDGAPLSAAADPLAPAPAVTLRKSAVVDANVTAAAQPPPAPAEEIDESKAPSWLKKGLEATISPKEEAAPAPEPIPAPAPSEPTPAQEPVAASESTPPWLEPAPEPAPAAPAPAPQPVPAPVTPAPAPAQETPSTDEGTVPPWLSAGMDTPIATPAQATEPAPVPAPEPVPATEPAAPATNDTALPPWLEEQPAPVAPTPMPEPIPSPVQETPTEQATLPPWLQQEPATTPVTQPAPAAEASEPAPLPSPAEETPKTEMAAPAPVATEPVSTPAPVPAAAVTTTQTTETPKAPTTSSATVTPSADEAAKAERERERRRRKRQRYRENLKKRQTADQAAGKTALAPAKKPMQTASAPVARSLPAEPAAEDRKTVPPADDSIAFVIRADSITPPEEPKDDDHGDVGHP